MRRVVFALVAVLIGAGFVRSAVAGEPALVTWTGFYIGLNAGYVAGHDTPERSLTAPACGGPACPALIALVASSAQSMDPHAFTGGFQAGYNYQLGRVVLGLEADISGFQLDDSNKFGPKTVKTGFPNKLATQDSLTTNRLLTLRPRLGVTADKFLVYVTGGLAVTDEEYSGKVTVTTAGPIGSFTMSGSRKAGWALGGGFEYALAPRWSVKAEYLRLDFGSVSGSVPVTAGVGGMTGSTLAFTNKLTADLVRAGINYRFAAQP